MKYISFIFSFFFLSSVALAYPFDITIKTFKPDLTAQNYPNITVNYGFRTETFNGTNTSNSVNVNLKGGIYWVFCDADGRVIRELNVDTNQTTHSIICGKFTLYHLVPLRIQFWDLFCKQSTTKDCIILTNLKVEVFSINNTHSFLVPNSTDRISKGIVYQRYLIPATYRIDVISTDQQYGCTQTDLIFNNTCSFNITLFEDGLVTPLFLEKSELPTGQGIIQIGTMLSFVVWIGVIIVINNIFQHIKAIMKGEINE
ncbi:MAG: hypothetical protein QXO57_02560 [Candidatus Aenigmatarchaeota archaeon]